MKKIQYAKLDINKTLQGHVLDMIKLIPDESIDCIITSPPYYQLRNYNTIPQIWGGDPECEHEWNTGNKINKAGGTKSASVTNNMKKETQLISNSESCTKCSAWKGELGHEPTIKMFIDHLIMVFDACKRVLKPTGTLWVNLGDSYIGSGKNKGNTSDKVYKQHSQSSSWDENIPQNKELPSKCLANVPSRFRIAICGCNAGFSPGIILDPFAGSGTTGITARKLNRNFINIELHPDNVQLNQDRIERKLGMFP